MNEAKKIDKPQDNGVLPCVSNSLPSHEDINKAISAIRQTYNDLVDGDTFPIDEFSSIALNLKYALWKLGNDC